MKIVHVTTGLGKGGAEGALYRLLKGRQGNTRHIVVSLTGEGYYSKELEEVGVEVIHLNLKSQFSIVADMRRLKNVIGTETQVVHCWMYHACFFGGIVAKFVGIKMIIWGIRHSELSWANNSLSVLLVESLCRLTARLIPTKIVFCADSSLNVHIKRGYPAKKSVVIYNGHNVVPNKDIDGLRSEFRQQQDIDENKILIGMAARWDKQKDHSNLVEALSLLKQQNNDKWVCILAGNGMSRDNKSLYSMLCNRSLEKHVILLGQVADLASFFAGIDIHVLSSLGEAFPNVLPEAMTCKAFCISTNVGDAAQIMGNNGIIVKKRDPQELSKAIELALNLKKEKDHWQHLLARAKDDIDCRFSFQAMKSGYEKLWNVVY